MRGHFKAIDRKRFSRLAAQGLSIKQMAESLGFTREGLYWKVSRESDLKDIYNKGRGCHGKPLFGAGRRRPLQERFWEKVQKTKGCWLWIGARNKEGYGHLTVENKVVLAHRVSFEMNVGPIPKGKLIRHRVCDNPPCVRPDHLEPGTDKENVADSVNKGRRALVQGKAHPRYKHGKYIKRPAQSC